MAASNCAASAPANRGGWLANCRLGRMKLEGTSAGLEAELRIAGFGRFFGAAFLAVWLAGWAVGEAFALWILGVGAWSLLTGQPPEVGRAPLRPELALPVGLFLLFWLAFWQTLANSGRLGRATLGVIERLTPSRTTRDVGKN